MNGQPLPDEHGGPLRVVVPGFIGARSVKWLRTLRIRSQPSTNFYMTSDYKKLPSRVGAEEKAEWMDKVNPLQETGLQSSIGKVKVDSDGRISVKGYALNGHGSPIKRVQVCVMLDEANSSQEDLIKRLAKEGEWREATLEQEDKKSGETVWSWTLFTLDFTLPQNMRGQTLAVFCRAGSEDGSMQESVSDW